MRHPSRFSASWSVTRVVILLNVVAFIVQNVSDSLQLRTLYGELTLSVEGLKHGHLWQLITSQFLHAPIADGGEFQLLANMFLIYLLGQPVEMAIGKRRFLELYLTCGALGSALQMAGGVFWPDRFGVAIMGASASAFGLIAAYAVLFPRRKLTMFFLPVAVHAWTLFGLAVTISLSGILYTTTATSAIAHYAHLGGLLAGLTMICYWAVRAPLVLTPVTQSSGAFATNRTTN